MRPPGHFGPLGGFPLKQTAEDLLELTGALGWFYPYGRAPSRSDRLLEHSRVGGRRLLESSRVGINPRVAKLPGRQRGAPRPTRVQVQYKEALRAADHVHALLTLDGAGVAVVGIVSCHGHLVRACAPWRQGDVKPQHPA